MHTSAGPVTADNVILATGIPFLDRGLYFVKVTPQRSYALAFRVPGRIPRGMYLSADSPTRSLRTARHDGEELLLVGGNGHPVGRHRQPPSELVADLTSWTERHFPGAERTHVWSAQDYQSHNSVPFVGKLPRGRGRIYLATGYGKWGMTNAVAAALRLSAELLGGHMPWAMTLGRRVSKPASAVHGVRENLIIGAAATQGWLGAELRPLSESDKTPPEGEGVVRSVRGMPVGDFHRRRPDLRGLRDLHPPGRSASVQRSREVLGLPVARVTVRRGRVRARGTGYEEPEAPSSRNPTLIVTWVCSIWLSFRCPRIDTTSNQSRFRRVSEARATAFRMA